MVVVLSLDLSALRKRKVMEATRRSSTSTGLTEDFMSTVSVSAPDPLGQKLGCGGAACQEYCLGTPEICGRENVMRCHSLKGFHPKWWCLSYWRSFQIGGTLIVI